MYRVGFGDCFLLTFNDDQHMLIDCGVHPHTPKETKGMLPAAIRHIREITGDKLALVVATHRHADHIAGFSKPENFDGISVGEVWLPWLEDLSDDTANAMRNASLAMASIVRADLTAAGADADELTGWMLANATGEPVTAGASTAGAAARQGPNDVAMGLLRGGFGDPKRVQYLRAGKTLTDAAGIEGLAVRVIAPSADTSFLGPKDPPKDQRYAADADGALSPIGLNPFAERWHLQHPKWTLEAEYLKMLVEEVALPTQAMAFKLDTSLNNTSLALILEYGGKTLFFPGDAQWGNWKSWQAQWPSILGNICFYKVGHHGSVNATPHEALGNMPSGKFVAMACTDTVQEFNRGENPVPFPKLVEAMIKQTGGRFVRSDQLATVTDPLFKVHRDGDLEFVDYEL